MTENAYPRRCSLFRHVLVPVDFADNNRASIDLAARLTDA